MDIAYESVAVSPVFPSGNAAPSVRLLTSAK